MTEPQPLAEQAARSLRRELARRDLGVEALARALRIPPRRAAALLSGEHPLTLDELDAAARWLGVGVGLLLEPQAPPAPHE